VRDRQGTREVGQEDRTRLERRDEQRLAACVRVGELCAELAYAPSDLRPGQVDIPDGVPFRRQDGG
jgi:hypothetical protein